MKEVEKNIKFVEDGWQNVPDSLKKDLLKQSGVLKDSVAAMKKLFRRQEEGKGILPDGDFIVGNIFETQGRIDESRGAPAENVQFLVSRTTQKIEAAVAKANESELLENRYARPFSNVKSL